MEELRIDSVKGYYTAIDPSDSPNNVFTQCRGGFPRLEGEIFRNDNGTINRYPVPPLRPNPFVNVQAVTGNVGGVATLQVDDGSHISNADTVYVDEMSTLPSLIGKWPVANKTTTFALIPIDSYSESHYAFDRGVYNGSNTKVGQSFIGNGQPLYQFVAYLKKGGAPTGNVTCNLYAHTGSFGSTGVPTGSPLATATLLDISTLATSYALISFVFPSPYTTGVGTDYVVTLEYSGGNVSNALYVGVDAPTPSAHGNFSSFFGSSWSADSTIDICFYCYSLASSPTYKFDLAGSVLGSGTYVSGGIVSKIPITIIGHHNFVDNNGTEYDIVVGNDSSAPCNMRVYVYDGGWIELTRFFTALVNGTPSAGSKVVTFDTGMENGTAHTFAVNELANYVLFNFSKTQSAGILSNTATTITTDTVLGANGLGWTDNDILQIYRFPALKFNYSYNNGGVYYDPTQAAIPPASYADADIALHGTMVLGKNTYVKNCTVFSDGILDLNNYQLFIQNPAYNYGIIHNNGNDAIGRFGGTAKSSGFYQSQGAGANGSVGPLTGYGGISSGDGDNGAARDTCLTNTPAPSSGHGGSGGYPGSASIPGVVGGGSGSPGLSSTVGAVISPSLQDIVNAIVQVYIAPIPGGASGGGQGAGSFAISAGAPGGDGGGSGAPAGILSVHCPKWYGNGKFQANGGKGADGANGGTATPYFDAYGNQMYAQGNGGGGGGGAGGPAGLLAIDCPDMTDFTGTIEAKGGAPGIHGSGTSSYSAMSDTNYSITSCTGNTVKPAVVGFASFASTILTATIVGSNGNTAINGVWIADQYPSAHDFPAPANPATSISLTNITGNGTWGGAGTIAFGSAAYTAQDGTDGLPGNAGTTYRYASAISSSGPLGQPWVEFMPEPTQRKVAMFYQSADKTKHQAIQIMKRDARDYFYDTSTTSYLRSLPAGWYIESDFGTLNPYSTTYGSQASPKSPGGGGFNQRAVAQASNTTPIVIETTATPTGLATGDIVIVAGTGGNTAANGTFSVTVLTPTTFQLDNSVGNGEWTTGGLITPFKNIAAIYDQAGGRKWMNLPASMSQSSFNAYRAVNYIWYAYHDGDAVIVNFAGIAKGYYASGSSGDFYFNSISGLQSLITRDFGTVLTASNDGTTITLTAINTGASYNSGYLALPATNAGSLGIGSGNVSTPGASSDFSGGKDVNSSLIYGRAYATVTYDGYQESDPILQTFFASDDPTQGAALLISPMLSFALMNKTITHINLYAAFQNKTVVSKGWIDDPNGYFLIFSLPIQSKTTDNPYVPTEWTDRSASLKNIQTIYSYDISQAQEMEASPASYDDAVQKAQATIFDNLNHTPRMDRTYPKPRFGVRLARTQGAMGAIDVDDNTIRFSLWDGENNQDDNYVQEMTSNDGVKLTLPIPGSGEILGVHELNGKIEVLRKTERLAYDMQSTNIDSVPCDCVSRYGIISSKQGFSSLAWCGNNGIYLLPSSGSQEEILSSPIQNLYDGTLLVTGTTPFMTSAFRSVIVGGWNEYNKTLAFVTQMNTSNGSECVGLMCSFADRGTDKIGWYQRQFNIGSNGSVRCFSRKQSDGSLTIVSDNSILKYPNTSTYPYQDDVLIDGSGAEHSQSKGIPLKFVINLGSVYSLVNKNVFDNAKIDFVGSSISGTGIVNWLFYINRRTTAAETKGFYIDKPTKVRKLPPLGSVESFSLEVNLTSGAEYDFKSFIVSAIVFMQENVFGLGNTY